MIIPELKEFILNHLDCYDENTKDFYTDPRIPAYLRLFNSMWRKKEPPFDNITLYPLAEESVKRLKDYISYYRKNCEQLSTLLFNKDDDIQKTLNLNLIGPVVSGLYMAEVSVKYQSQIIGRRVIDKDPFFDGIRFTEVDREHDTYLFIDALREDAENITFLNEFFEYYLDSNIEEDILKYLLSFVDKASDILDAIMKRLPDKIVTPLSDTELSTYMRLIQKQREVTLSEFKNKLRASMKEEQL